jgi:hypothetical protein
MQRARGALLRAQQVEAGRRSGWQDAAPLPSSPLLSSPHLITHTMAQHSVSLSEGTTHRVTVTLLPPPGSDAPPQLVADSARAPEACVAAHHAHCICSRAPTAS